MKSNQTRNRRVFLFLLVLLLVSLSVLALEYTTYSGGGWQTVQGQGLSQTNQNKQPFIVPVPSRPIVTEDNWEIVREGRLFFLPLPVEDEVSEELPDVIEISEPFEHIVTPVETPKPTCPFVVAGIMMGKESTAILVNKSTQKSQTVKVGSSVDKFEVVEIEKSYVLVKSSEADFKLELGGM